MSFDPVPALQDAGSGPAFVVDAQSRILDRNAAADGLLQAGSFLVERSGSLYACRRADNAALLARVATLSALHNPALADPAPLRIQGVRPYVLTFEGLGGRAPRPVLIRGQDSFAGASDLCAAFARSHDLGKAEERLLHALVHDETLADYCKREDRKVLTERSRLSAMYRRAGVRNQSSLIIAVLTGVQGTYRREATPPPGGRAPSRPVPGAGGATQTRPIRALAKGEPRPPLPSFAGLTALEAFVRLGSMSAAADSLGTTPPNISRHIRKLEASTGLTLTQGSRPQVVPTGDARTLALAVADALKRVRRAAPRLFEKAEDRRQDKGCLSASGFIDAPSAGNARASLPSLTTLKALEAFVRLGSFTAAALELRTLPSNIGRYIRSLEAITDTALVHGERTRTRPSAAGERMAAAAGAAFDRIHHAAPSVSAVPRKPSAFLRARGAHAEGA